MMKHNVMLLPSGKRGAIPAGTTVLEAAEILGLEIESICGGRQVCGKCLIVPESGNNLSAPDATEQAYALKHRLDLSEVR
ncbi:MAG TPA: 2Fe-2S iron-sulfur cluster-binding protein, partial [Aggregatilineales bacterium]|nr:2Fe-2S iron-sulfur cluster-binding protein [Aggregatilineales bacterium]